MLPGKKETFFLLMIGKFLAVLLSIVINVEGKSIVEEARHVHSSNRVRACGNGLKQEIESICSLSNINSNGLYYVPGVPAIIEPRRSSPYANSNDRQRQQVKTTAIPSRAIRGVIEECCRKPCNRLQLLKYCAIAETKDETTSTTTTPSPTEHHLHKRTSSSETNNNSKRQFKSNKPLQLQKTVSNCLHCVRNKNRRNKKSSDCGRSHGRKIRRRKSRMDEEQTLLLPLLLQLLWGWDSKTKTMLPTRMKNFFPHNLSPEVQIRRQTPESGRGISARDIYQNQFSFLQSRLIPSSDETRLDVSGSGKSNVGDDPSNNGQQIETQATLYTEAPIIHFAISDGTNAELFYPTN